MLRIPIRESGPLCGTEFRCEYPPPAEIRMVNGRCEPPITHITESHFQSLIGRCSKEWRDDFTYRLVWSVRAKRGFPFLYWQGIYVPSYSKQTSMGRPNKHSYQKVLCAEPSIVESFDRWWVWVLAKHGIRRPVAKAEGRATANEVKNGN
jgi:hypothetical protein